MILKGHRVFVQCSHLRYYNTDLIPQQPTPDIILFDTNEAISSLIEHKMTPAQSRALTSAIIRLTSHHLSDTLPKSCLSRSELTNMSSSLSNSLHDLHTALTSLSHQNTLAHLAAHDRTTAALQSTMDSLRESTANTRTELGMLLAAGKAEMRGEAATVEMAVAREEATLGAAVAEIKTRLEKGKIAVIAAFVAGMVSCFGLVSWTWKRK